MWIEIQKVKMTQKERKIAEDRISGTRYFF